MVENEYAANEVGQVKYKPRHWATFFEAMLHELKLTSWASHIKLVGDVGFRIPASPIALHFSQENW